MKKLTIKQITELQKEHDVFSLQQLITSGQVWGFEGSYGRAAMEALESGSCFLPEKPTRDYYGNHIPSRNDLKPGTKGTLKNSQRFWEENN